MVILQIIILYLQTLIGPRFFIPFILNSNSEENSARIFYKSKEEIEKEKSDIIEVILNKLYIL